MALAEEAAAKQVCRRQGTAIWHASLATLSIHIILLAPIPICEFAMQAALNSMAVQLADSRRAIDSLEEERGRLQRQVVEAAEKLQGQVRQAAWANECCRESCKALQQTVMSAADIWPTCCPYR